MKTEANGGLEKHMAMSRALDCPYEEWDADRILGRLPIYRLDRFAPAKRMDDAGFRRADGRGLDRRGACGPRRAMSPTPRCPRRTSPTPHGATAPGSASTRRWWRS